jgi:hypothetical protein
MFLAGSDSFSLSFFVKLDKILNQANVFGWVEQLFIELFCMPG